MKILLMFGFFLITINSFAKEVMVDINSGYHSRESTPGSKYNSMENHIFIGMAVAVKDQLYIGPNFTLQSTDTDGVGFSTIEIGPRINYYMNSDKTFLVILAWNPSVSFKYKTSNTVSDDISGSSYLMGLGYEMKVNNNFYIGASIVYHSLDVTTTTSGAKSEVNYSTLNPMLNFSFRFK